MIGRFPATRWVASSALALVVFWSAAGAFPRPPLADGQEPSLWIQEGKRLYESGEYEEAILRLLEGLKKTKVKTEAADARFYLSLSYYALGRNADCQAQLQELFKLQPERTIDERYYAAGYIELYRSLQSARSGGQPAAPAGPQVAVKEAPAKAGGGKKFPWLIVAGGAVAVGVAAVLLLGKKSSTTSTPQTGSISIVSAPADAKVFLDGTDTGQRSNCTLANVAPGSHDVRLDLEDFGRWEGAVSVTAGQTTQVNVVLSPFIYNFITTWGSHGSANAQFETPIGIWTQSTGETWVADSGNNRVQKFSSDGSFLTKWGSPGSGNGKLNSPQGIAISSGNVFVTDTENNRVQKFTVNGGYISKWGDPGTGNGQFMTPIGIAADGAGKLFVVDYGNCRVQVFHEDGSFVQAWGGYGSGDGQFNFPWGVAVDKDGYVYVADTGNNRIQKFRSDGTFVLKYGSPGAGDGQMNNPRGVGVDRYGYVFVADSDNNRIQKYTPGGLFMIRWGQQGTATGSFYDPKGVGCDDSDNLYVLDTVNNRIQKFRISVQVTGGAASIQTIGPQLPPAGLLRPGGPLRPLGGPPRAPQSLPSQRRDRTRH
jgi:sugar lactone lactonase YvrE